MLMLRVFGDKPTIVQATTRLSELPGASHLTQADTGADDGRAVVTADLDTGTADAALLALRRLGVRKEDISLLRVEAIGTAPHRTTRANLLWADLLGQAGENARPLARYLVRMGIAGIIAG
ncbi:MAG TPA: hypothetical protein VIQ02_06630 [Jiangellaceae bacterium]